MRRGLGTRRPSQPSRAGAPPHPCPRWPPRTQPALSPRAAHPLLTPLLPPRSRSLGKTYHVLGKYNEAITHHERAVGISVAIGDRKGEAADLGHLGAAYNRIGQFPEGVEYITRALAISIEVRANHSPPLLSRC